MGYDVATINAVEQGLPLITVAANFQSEPVGLIAHPDVEKIEDLKTRTLLIGQASETTYWPWLKAKYGFTEAQKRPYAYSVQQFLVDKNIAQQGYITSEPYAIEQGGVKPVIFHLARYGYPPYAQTDRDPDQNRQAAARRRQTLHRSLRTGLEELPEESCAGQCAHPEGQSADGRRAARVQPREAQGIRHRRRRRCEETRPVHHDR